MTLDTGVATTGAHITTGSVLVNFATFSKLRERLRRWTIDIPSCPPNVFTPEWFAFVGVNDARVGQHSDPDVLTRVRGNITTDPFRVSDLCFGTGVAGATRDKE